MKTLSHLEAQVIGATLRNMFQNSSFSICAVDNCLKIAGITPTAPEYKMLRALHCVPFADMPADLRDEVPTMVGACFIGVDAESSAAISAAMTRKDNGTQAQTVDATPPPRNLLELTTVGRT